MPILLRIALRNLFQHKAKTLIICGLIAGGMMLLVVGNSIIETGWQAVQKSFVKNFSGHILVGTPGEQGQDPNMWPGTGFSMGVVKTIDKYKDVFSYLQSLPEVDVINPQVAGGVMIEITDLWKSRIPVFAYDPAYYDKMFPGNTVILQGENLKDGEEGLLLAEHTWKDISEKTGVTYKIGDLVKCLSFADTSIKIKKVPLRGIYKFTSDNTALDDVGIMDLSSMRYLRGLVVGSADQMKISDTDLASLNVASDDDFFSDDLVVGTKINSRKSLSEAEFDNILGDTSNTAALNKADAGSWYYVLLRLKNEKDMNAVVEKLNIAFKEKGWELKAVNWQIAAGMIAQLAVFLQLGFSVAVFIICVVSIFVIMNTMLVSTMERTAEIGTMRALGAQKSYIRTVFLLETLSLSFIGGLIGLFLSVLQLILFNTVGIPSGGNPMLQTVFGGDTLHPVLSLSAAGMSMILMIIVGYVSSIYPTIRAMKIQPVVAMQSQGG